MYKLALIEIVDRYCIAELKCSKGLDAVAERDFYKNQLSEYDVNLIKPELDKLYQVHARVWELEDDFKKYRVEQKYSLEEVGRRALHVRDIMEERYYLKNLIASKLNDPIKEVKKYG